MSQKKAKKNKPDDKPQTGPEIITPNPTVTSSTSQPNENTTQHIPSGIPLCKTFTDKRVSGKIGTLWLQLLLEAEGYEYKPTSAKGLMAQQLLNEDIKSFALEAFDMTIPKDVSKLNYIWESALIKTDPIMVLAGMYGDAISPERVRDLQGSLGLGGAGGMMGAMSGGSMDPMTMMMLMNNGKGENKTKKSSMDPMMLMMMMNKGKSDGKKSAIDPMLMMMMMNKK